MTIKSLLPEYFKISVKKLLEIVLKSKVLLLNYLLVFHNYLKTFNIVSLVLSDFFYKEEPKFQSNFSGI